MAAQVHPEYIAPEVTVTTTCCEQGYATSAYHTTLLPSENDNTASTYEHTTWEW